jgi:hypothetical protein
MFADFVERLDSPIVIIPYQQLALQYTLLLDLAAYSVEFEAVPQRAMNPYAVASRVPSTLGEYLDTGSRFANIDMDLAVFSIILPLRTHPSWTSQLAAMCDASCFSIGWSCSHYANFWFKLSVGGFPQFTSRTRR